MSDGIEDYPAHKSDSPSDATNEVAPSDRKDHDAATPRPFGPSEDSTPPSPLEINEVKTQNHRLKKALSEKEAQLSKVMDAYRRLKKETERVRQRLEKSQKQHIQRSKNEFIGQFVDVLDNLDRAIDSIENNFDSDSVLQGIILLRSRLVQLLRQEGLEKIFVGGQPFDPTHSEAAAIEEVDNQAQHNVVLKELQRGYMLRGSLLRPARVVVGRFSGSQAETYQDAPPDALDGSEDNPFE